MQKYETNRVATIESHVVRRFKKTKRDKKKERFDVELILRRSLGKKEKEIIKEENNLIVSKI